LACVEYANAYSLLEPTQIVGRERVLEAASKAIEKILAEYGIDLTKLPAHPMTAAPEKMSEGRKGFMTPQTLSGRILSVATDHARALDLLPPGAEQARARVTEAFERAVEVLLQEHTESILLCGEH
jgi:hypothetical protein